MEKNLSINFSTETKQLVKEIVKCDSLEKGLKIMLAIAGLSLKKVNVDKAAEIAEMPVDSFVELLNKNNIRYKVDKNDLFGDGLYDIYDLINGFGNDVY